MSKAQELRTKLDQLNAEYVELDQKMAADRERLYALGKQRGDLEIEFQRADAAEKQAAIDVGQKGQTSSG